MSFSAISRQYFELSNRWNTRAGGFTGRKVRLAEDSKGRPSRALNITMGSFRRWRKSNMTRLHFVGAPSLACVTAEAAELDAGIANPHQHVICSLV